MDDIEKRLLRHYQQQQPDRVGAHDRRDIARFSGDSAFVGVGLRYSRESIALSNERSKLRPTDPEIVRTVKGVVYTYYDSNGASGSYDITAPFAVSAAIPQFSGYTMYIVGSVPSQPREDQFELFMDLAVGAGLSASSCEFGIAASMGIVTAAYANYTNVNTHFIPPIVSTGFGFSRDGNAGGSLGAMSITTTGGSGRLGLAALDGESPVTFASNHTIFGLAWRFTHAATVRVGGITLAFTIPVIGQLMGIVSKP